MDSSKLGGIGYEGINMDPLGVFYIVFACVYTVIVTGGLFMLWKNRNHEAIRVRGVGITFATVCALHVYLILVVLAYPVNDRYKCGVDFWIMSIFLPLGMGLFQACNIRILSRSLGQMRMARSDVLGQRKQRFDHSLSGLVRKFRELDIASRTYIGIGVGFGVTAVTTLILYCGSRSFHASYGLFGDPKRAIKCEKGPEWIPSIFWQLLWNTVFGPYVLWKIRKINDMRYWAWQTRLSIVSGLPGTPLWLIFAFGHSDNIAKINRYFPAPGWYIPGLITMQQVLILIPLYDALRSVKPGETQSKVHSRSESVLSKPSSERRRSRDLYSSAALDDQIEREIEPLIEWAARKEFTAENVIFLKEVRDFKRKWAISPDHPPLTKAERCLQFSDAAMIFFSLVEKSTAEFNINIDSKLYDNLASYFKHLKYMEYEDEKKLENVVTPWDNLENRRGYGSFCFTADGHKVPLRNAVISAKDAPNLTVPEEFHVDIFKGAYSAVRYLVLTNTWVRFVDRSEISSLAGSEWSEDSFVSVSKNFELREVPKELYERPCR